MENKKISIIIPIYNVEKYLDKCVESAVNQTYKNLEIILVDDGSPDNCPQMCDEWAKKDNRIKVIHKQNGGLSDARNFGIEAASGDYLMFVDSDDYLDSKMCEKLFTLLEENNADFSICDCLKFYEDGIFESQVEEPKIAVYKGQDVVNQIYNSEHRYLGISCAKLFRKELFANIRYPIGRLHEDIFVFPQIMHDAKRFVSTNERLYYYLQRKNSIMGKRGQKSIIDSMTAFKQMYDFLNEKYPENARKNTIWYLGILRNLYILKIQDGQKLKKEILNEFKSVYKQEKKTGFKNWLFKNFRFVYLLILKLK